VPEGVDEGTRPALVQQSGDRDDQPPLSPPPSSDESDAARLMSEDGESGASDETDDEDDDDDDDDDDVEADGKLAHDRADDDDVRRLRDATEKLCECFGALRNEMKATGFSSAQTVSISEYLGTISGIVLEDAAECHQRPDRTTRTPG